MMEKDSLLATVTASASASDSDISPLAAGEVVIGTLVAIDKHGHAMVRYSLANLPNTASDEPIQAIATVSVTRQHLGRQTALLFADGDPNKPVIVGFVHSPIYELLDNFEMLNVEAQATAESSAELPAINKADNNETITVDGKKVVIEGEDEIVLKCGEASITLTKAGKILIRGKYLLNRSSGVNRILGGSVQVN